MPDALLVARGIEAGYGSRQILFGVDLEVAAGEAVALLGANGSGKSTVLNALSGFVRPRRGSIQLGGQELAGLSPHRIFRRGIVQVSQAPGLVSRDVG
ncbi:MAG: ATP-binding cassette domain-containing protein [Acetobacteraceae bacterium]